MQFIELEPTIQSARKHGNLFKSLKFQVQIHFPKHKVQFRSQECITIQHQENYYDCWLDKDKNLIWIKAE